MWGWDLDGWKDIADALGVSVRTAQRWSREHAEGPDAMPVDALHGRVKASRAALRAWAERVGLVRRRGSPRVAS
jgi:hypothetical protein